MKTILSFLLLSLGIMLHSCISYEPVEVISLDEVELKSITPSGISITVKVTISNPNDYNITLDSEGLNLSFNESSVGIASIEEPVKLLKSSNQQYTMNISSTIPDDGNIDLGILVMGGLSGKLKMKVEGEVQAKAKGLSKTIPVSITEDIYF